MASLFKRKDRSDYYGKFKLPNGKWKVVRLSKDRQVSLQKLAKLERAAARGEAGLVDPFIKVRTQPIGELLDAYLLSREVNRVTKQYVAVLRARLRKAFEGMRVSTILDVSKENADRYLLHLERNEGLARKTAQHYSVALRGFGDWLVSSNRWSTNPLADLCVEVTERDIRRVRRALTSEELARLAEAAEVRQVVEYRKRYPAVRDETLTAFQRQGRRRSRSYLFAGYTGLRHVEVARLTWADLELDPNGGRVCVRAANSKNKKTQYVRLAPWLSVLMQQERETRSFEEGRPIAGTELVFDVSFHITRLLARDAEYAGLGKRDERGLLVDGEGRILDFHSLRVTCGTMLARAGVSPQAAQKFLRHSDPRLTLRHYTKLEEADVADAAARLPPPPGLAPPVAPKVHRSGTLPDASSRNDSESGSSQATA